MTSPGKLPFGAPFQQRMPFDMSAMGRYPLNVPTRDNLPVSIIPPERFPVGGVNFPVHLNSGSLNMTTNDKMPLDICFPDRIPQSIAPNDRHSLNLSSQMRMPSGPCVTSASCVTVDKNKAIPVPNVLHDKNDYNKCSYDLNNVKTEHVLSPQCAAMTSHNLHMSASSTIPLFANSQLYPRNIGCMEEAAVECLHNLYKDSKQNTDKPKNGVDNKMGQTLNHPKHSNPLNPIHSLGSNLQIPDVKGENSLKATTNNTYNPNFLHCNMAKDTYDPDGSFMSGLMLKRPGVNGFYNECPNEGNKEKQNLQDPHLAAGNKSQSGQQKQKTRNNQSEATHVCPYCEKKFKRKDHLSRHKNKVHGNMPPLELNQSCPVSTEYNNTGVSLKTSESEYRCYVNNLKESIIKLLVSKDCPYQCPDCQKIFTRKDHVLRHRLTHSKLKPYECDICLKIFTRKDHMIRHRNIHTKERPYECHYCDKVFSRKDHLDRHIQKNHIEQPKLHVGELGS